MTPKLKTILDKATARPWETETGLYGHKDEVTIWGAPEPENDNCHEFIATVDAQRHAKANARLLTLAANHFAALVEALEFMFESNQDEMRPHGAEGVIVTHEAYMNARAVLAAIEKELDP